MNNLEYYMNLPYRMVIIPDTVEGGFTVSFPDLPGCLTCADTLEDAISNAADAKRSWLAAALDEGIRIFDPTKENQNLSNFSGQFKLRLPKSLHRDLADHAKEEGVSMNQYCIYLLSMNDARHTASYVFELYGLLQDGLQDVREGKTRPFPEAIADIRAKRQR